MLSLGGNLPEGSSESAERVMALEKASDIAIPDEDAEKIRTLQGAVDHIRRKKGDLN